MHRFSPQELALLKQAVNAYLPYEEVRDMLSTLEDGINGTIAANTLKGDLSKAVSRLKDRPEISYVVEDTVDKFPLLKFVSVLSEFDPGLVYPRSVYDTKAKIRLKYNADGSTPLTIYGTEKGRPEMPIYFSRTEVHLLVAFILYHELQYRGVEHSGIAGTGEERLKGEEGNAEKVTAV